MPPQKRAQCQICQVNESKYTCARCMVVYCSVACYKQHKETSCSAGNAGPSDATPIMTLGSSHEDANTSDLVQHDDGSARLNRVNEQLQLEDTSSDTKDHTEVDADAETESVFDPPDPPLRPLTSLRWPYVPDESAYPDPLKRDDPKFLQLHQYEAIATSPTVRKALASNPQLPALLRSIDALRGEEREDALQRALGVSIADLAASASGTVSRSRTVESKAEEDVRAMRALAEAVEAAVRGGKEDALGLDWGDE